jgi:hypothetical protein
MAILTARERWGRGEGRRKVMRFMNFIYGLQIPIYDLLNKLTVGSVEDLENPYAHLQYMSIFNCLGFCTNQSLVD